MGILGGMGGRSKEDIMDSYDSDRGLGIGVGGSEEREKFKRKLDNMWEDDWIDNDEITVEKVNRRLNDWE